MRIIVPIAVAALALAACHREPPTRTDEPAPTPAVAMRPPPPAPEEVRAAAFAAAFPRGGLVGEGDRQTQFVARDLAPLSGGDHVAVLADGTGVGLNTCRDCTGALRVTYVRRQGTGFVPLSPAILREIPGTGAGGPPDWTLDVTGPRPVVATRARPDDCATTRAWRLDPDAIVEDPAAARRVEKACRAGAPEQTGPAAHP